MSGRGAFRTVSYFGVMHLRYGKVPTLFEVQSGSMVVSAKKTARLGSEESSMPEPKPTPLVVRTLIRLQPYRDPFAPPADLSLRSTLCTLRQEYR